MTSQRGGFVLGLVIGLLVGLALALAVALYITKAPVPFVNKVPQRTAEQDNAEAERNKNWDPNAPLAGKPGKAPTVAASAPPVAAVPAASAAAKPARDPAAILSQGAPSTTPAPDAFQFYVQAGAFTRAEDAEQQRAKLAMLGYAAKVTEREQSGRTVFRVRAGPYDTREAADGAQAKLQEAGVEARLVRVEK